MKPVIIFFFSLCFILTGGYKYSHTEVQEIRKTAQAKFGNPDHDSSILKKHHLSEKREDFLGDEDDEDLTFSRKYFSQVKYFITLAYASVLVCLYHYFKNRLPFCRHLSYTASYKYLLQRVLRI